MYLNCLVFPPEKKLGFSVHLVFVKFYATKNTLQKIIIIFIATKL